MRNSTNLKNWVVISVFLVVLAAPATTAAGGTIYVDGDARNGWLRIMKFVPAEDKIYVKTFSPYLTDADTCDIERNDRELGDGGCYETDEDSKFDLPYSTNAFKEIGQDSNIASGDNAVYNWENLKSSTNYEWFVEVVDSDNANNVSDMWNFTTGTS